MGLFDSIFGSREEEIDPGVPQITNIPTKTAEQTDFTKQLNLLLSGITGGGGRAQGFQGDLTAGPSNLQNQSFSNISQLLGQGGIGQQGASAFSSAALSDFDPASTEQFFNKSVVAPSQRRFEREILPGIREGFAGTGDSGALNRALANAGVDLELGRQSTLADLLFQGEQKQLDRQSSGGLQAILASLGLGQQAGGTQRGIEQEGLSNTLNEFIRSQGVDPLLGLSPTALGVNTFDPLVQIPNQQFGQSSASQVSSLLGGAGKLAGGIASFF